jgi:hypothetical protein
MDDTDHPREWLVYKPYVIKGAKQYHPNGSLEWKGNRWEIRRNINGGKWQDRGQAGK